MNGIAGIRLSPSISEACPGFAEKMAEYNRAIEAGNPNAHLLFLDAQAIARAFRKATGVSP